MTYQIHRYPAELIDVVHLAGGERIVIRPVLPQDADLTDQFFRDQRQMVGVVDLREVPHQFRRQLAHAGHEAVIARRWR